MEVICLETAAFYALVEEVVQRISAKNAGEEDRWIGQAEAMQKLRIKSKTTLQKLRDHGEIRFSQPKKKLILYDTNSIMEYLESHARETF